MTATAQILCTKCGAASAHPVMECAKCGGRTARVCSKCGTQNSIAKNYCDKCGQMITQLGPIAPPPKTALPGLPAANIPKTAIQRAPPEAPPKNAPAAGFSPVARNAGGSLDYSPLVDSWKETSPSAAASQTRPAPPKRGVVKSAVALLAILAIGVGGWRYFETLKPEVLVPKLGAEYLEALRNHDYSRAYQMFSDSAKRNCTEDEFRDSRTASPWTWSDLQISYQEPGAILLSYMLTPQGAPPRRDHVLFTLEKSRWTRPFNWTLIQQVEDAFTKGDPDKGLLLAQAAATVNPRDPMAWGYLCEAAYYRRLPQDAVTRCLKSLELARTYPSNLSPKSLYHLYAILADTYHHALKRPDLSLEQYSAMLSFPNISPSDQCTVLLARSQAFRELSRFADASSDLDRAAPLCPAPDDKELIRRMRAAMAGATQ